MVCLIFVCLPHIPTVFSGNYSEAATKDLGDDTVDEDAIAEHYDYNSDSDLEDAEDLKPAEGPPPLRRVVSGENDSPDSSNDGTANEKPQDTR